MSTDGIVLVHDSGRLPVEAKINLWYERATDVVQDLELVINRISILNFFSRGGDCREFVERRG